MFSNIFTENRGILKNPAIDGGRTRRKHFKRLSKAEKEQLLYVKFISCFFKQTGKSLKGVESSQICKIFNDKYIPWCCFFYAIM